MSAISFTPVIRIKKQHSNERNRLHRITIRTTVDRKHTYQKTNHSVISSDWDADKCRVRPRADDAMRINSSISRKIRKLNDFVEELEKQGKRITIDDFRTKPLSKEIIAFASNYLATNRSKWSTGYCRLYEVQVRKLSAYGGNHITFDEITHEWLRKYEAYLRAHLEAGTSVNTAWRWLRRVFNAAINEKLTTNYPFKTYTNPKYIQPLPTFYLEEEFAKLEDLLLQPLDLSLVVTANYFLLGCYSGLRVSDWQRFNYTGFVRGDKLLLRAKKNGEIVSLRMHKRLQAVVERLKDLPPCPSDVEVNRNLKVIARLAGLVSSGGQEAISSHQARHSYAVHCAELNIPPSKTAVLMGISERTVAVYYSITNRSLEAEFSKWDKKK